MTEKKDLSKWSEAAEEIMKHMDYMEDADYDAKLKVITAAVRRALT